MIVAKCRRLSIGDCNAVQRCRDPGSKQEPSDLQSDALPTELPRPHCTYTPLRHKNSPAHRRSRRKHVLTHRYVDHACGLAAGLYKSSAASVPFRTSDSTEDIDIASPLAFMHTHTAYCEDVDVIGPSLTARVVDSDIHTCAYKDQILKLPDSSRFVATVRARLETHVMPSVLCRRGQAA